MRAASLIPVLMISALMILAVAAPSRSEPPNINRSAATESEKAGWADLDAQARMADGDYDGAVQAEQRADAERKQAEHVANHGSARPPANEPVPSH